MLGAALPLLLAGASCASNRPLVRIIPSPSSRRPDVEATPPRVLSSPVDCADTESASNGGACESGSASVLVCAHGTATVKASSTVGWQVTDDWLKATESLRATKPTLRCSLGDRVELGSERADETTGLLLPMAMPLTAARWLSVARALDDFTPSPATSPARPWAVLDRHEQELDGNANVGGGEAQTKATRVTTQWRSGQVRCTTVTEQYRDRAMSGAEVSREADGGGSEDASSMDWLESGVTGAFGLKVASHPHLGYVLEAFHEQHVQSGLRAGLFAATKLTCTSPSAGALTVPLGFDVSLRLSRTGQAWVASAQPR